MDEHSINAHFLDFLNRYCFHFEEQGDSAAALSFVGDKSKPDENVNVLESKYKGLTPAGVILHGLGDFDNASNRSSYPKDGGGRSDDFRLASSHLYHSQPLINRNLFPKFNYYHSSNSGSGSESTIGSSFKDGGSSNAIGPFCIEQQPIQISNHSCISSIISNGSSNAASASCNNVCAHCGTANTPMWRRVNEEKVCNACGLYYKTNGKKRTYKDSPKRTITALSSGPASGSGSSGSTKDLALAPSTALPLGHSLGITNVNVALAQDSSTHPSFTRQKVQAQPSSSPTCSTFTP